jgi:hypothetical protein
MRGRIREAAGEYEAVFEDFADKSRRGIFDHEPDMPAISLSLTEAQALKPSGLPGIRPPFSLIFVGRDSRVLPQRLYRLEPAPVGRDAQGVRYQAVFN